MNPFTYGTIVSGEDFCGRKALLNQIVAHIESSRRIVLLGERRIGKSSAVHEAVLRCSGRRLLYVDLLGIKSIDALCRRMLRAMVIAEKKAGWLEKAVKSLAYLRPSISADPITSLPTVSFDSSVELRANSIPEVLTLVESLGKKKKPLVVFDEFQDILNVEDSYEALALLRSGIQFQVAVPYLFVGSIRHKMDAIFTHHDSPFFKSAIPMTVPPLPREEFSVFLKTKFMKGQRKIEDKTLQKVFEIGNDITGDIQQLCEALWEVTSEGDIIALDSLKSALELIFSREQKSYENTISLLTAIQLKCLRAIAAEGGKGLFSNAFMKSAGFNNSSTVKRAATRLANLNILFEIEGEYRFANPFFRAWIIARGA